MCLYTQPENESSHIHIRILQEGFDALSRVHLTCYVSMQAASLICKYVRLHVHVCEAM